MRDDRSTDQQLLDTHRKRLQALQIQAATFGIHVPAQITIEIDAIKAQIVELEQRLALSPAGGTAGRHRDWLVDQMHRGDVTTIGKAIAAAKPGDRILVRSGVYYEALVLEKPLELIGEGEPGDVLVQASECARGLVKNLTLRQTRGELWTVNISSGRLDFENGGGTFEHNTLTNNKAGNWDIACDCLPRVTRKGNTE